jgi:CRP/FNR family transcriptional regulator, polysaccharide utilization system transcription regulator
MSKIIETNCLACQKRADIFNYLSEEEINLVDCERISIAYNPGEIIFKQGTPCHNVVCITSGLVKMYLEHENSHNVILGLAKPVTYLFVPGAFTDQRHHYTAVACEDTTACLIDKALMRQLLIKNPEFANEFINKISGQVIELFDKISVYTQKHVFGRMADTLIYLKNRVYGDNRFELTISRQDLADLSGMTKESAIRVMKKFKEDNILTLEGNHLEILDLQKLEAISKNG